MLPDGDGEFLEKVEWRSGEGGTAPDPKVAKDKVAAKLVRLAGMWRKGSLEKLLESRFIAALLYCTEMQPGKKTDFKGPS